VARVELEFRIRDSDRLQAQSKTGDLHAGADRSFAVDRSRPDEPTKAAKAEG
jgi:hypothetical protein